MSAKCPECEEMLNADSAVSHLTVKHQMGLRDAMRWAGLHIDINLVGQGDGKGQSHYTQKVERSSLASKGVEK